MPEIMLESDGFYHPQNEDQIIELVKRAYNYGLEIRCRGSAHSVSHAIYTDPGQGDPPVKNKVLEQDPPKGPNINIMLDKYAGLYWIDEVNGIVEADAGIHLGYDPEDPTGTSTLENSFLYQIFQKGWALADTGGITHQTVSGFLSTGSAGGTLMYTLDENLVAFRVIDGTGQAQWVEKDKDEELFNALGVSLGLLGIISKVRFKLTKNYYIYGQQITTPTAFKDCPIDLFGGGTPNKPSLSRFLRETPYTRILWWPQKDVERVVIWEAVRGDAIPIFDPVPYYEFTDESFSTNLEEMLGALLFTTLGNKGFFKTYGKLFKDFKQFNNNIQKMWGGGFFAWIFSNIITFIIMLVSLVAVLFFSIFRPVLLWLYPKLLDILQPLTKNGKALLFMDYMWRSLPMDDMADDILMGTEFTEIWVPLEHTERSMQLLKQLFKDKGTAASSYYSTELYAGIKSNFWLSPSYKQDMFRIDVFWYINNEGDIAHKNGFYSQFWDLLRKEGIPFRLHWGKFIPEYDYPEWAAYYKNMHPRWDDFMALRAKRDPKNIFLNDYWSLHLFGKKKS